MSDVTGYSHPFPTVALSCEAVVAGETIRVHQVVPKVVYDDPEARPMILQGLREGLIRAILEKWTPVVTIR